MICLPVPNIYCRECVVHRCHHFGVKRDWSELGTVSENPSSAMESSMRIRIQREGSVIITLLHSAERRDFSRICAYGRVHQAFACSSFSRTCQERPSLDRKPLFP